MSWYEFDNGSTLGERGTEGGDVVKDEEFDNSARITLEKFPDGHYAVTCGVYGAFFHTAWFSEFEKYEQMKSDIENILSEESDDDFYRLVEEFTDKY